MGILGLSKLIFDKAPSSVKENEMKSYFGRKVAIDASMSIYQFLIAIRQDGAQLTNDDGEVTSHLAGIFYRTLRMCDMGIKPVWVFDGKPPDMKSGELAKRKERREEAQKKLDEAVEAGEDADVDKYQRRLVKVTRENVEDCKKLIRLMGIPVVEAPTEAEAQCAQLVKSGKVYAAATEDMDALTFSSNRLLRHMTFSEARKMPIQEFNLEKLLQEMEMTQDEFIDLCILLGCDYCDSISGIGPKRAYTLIKEHKSIEEILKHIDTKKYKVPEDWLFKEARKLFQKPDVKDGKEVELKWNDPDEEALIEFMCKEKGFNEDRIRNGIKKLLKSKKQSTQGRLEDFFKVKPSTPNNKRKSDGKIKNPVKKLKTETKPKFKRPR